jgi:TPR repeat protein
MNATFLRGFVLIWGLLLPIAGCSSSPPTSQEAAGSYRKSADQGSPQAQLDRGLAYDLGLGVPLDKAEAETWWRKAAEQGDSGAVKNLVQLRAERWTPPPCADSGIPKAWRCRKMPPRLSPRR